MMTIVSTEESVGAGTGEVNPDMRLLESKPKSSKGLQSTVTNS